MIDEELIAIVEKARQQLIGILDKVGFPANIDIQLHNVDLDTALFVAAARRNGWTEDLANGTHWIESPRDKGSTTIFF